MTTKQQKNRWVQQFIKNGVCPHGCGTTLEQYGTDNLSHHVLFCKTRWDEEFRIENH